MIPSDISPTILIDRLFHASDGKDAYDAIQQLLTYTKALPKSSEANSSPVELKKHEINQQRRKKFIIELLSSYDFIYVTLSSDMLLENKLIGTGVYVEEGCNKISEMFTNILSNSDSNIRDYITLLLNYPTLQLDNLVQEHGRKYDETSTFLSLILDFICNLKSTNFYPKILFIGCLKVCFQYEPKLTQEGVIQTPVGFHGLVSLLSSVNNGGMEEIRNEVLLLLLQVASSTSSTNANVSVIRKMLLFEDVMELLCSVVVKEEGGLNCTNEAIVIDCLELCKILIVNEENGGEMFLGSGICMESVSQLLNLYSVPVPALDVKKKDIDLDEMLYGEEKKPAIVEKWIPLKTDSKEEKIVMQVLFLLEVSFSSSSLTSQLDQEELTKYHRRIVKFTNSSNQSTKQVLSLLNSLALFSKFTYPTQAQRTSPSTKIQAGALQIMYKLSNILSRENDTQTKNLILEVFPFQNNLSTIDALFQVSFEQNDIAFTTISILRQLLSSSQACVYILHAYTPPPNENERYNLIILDLAIQVANDQRKEAALLLGMVCITGGNGGAREMLLKLNIGNQQESIPFLNVLVDLLEKDLEEEKKCVVIRLLCEWCLNCPNIVQYVLENVKSYTLFTTMFMKNEKQEVSKFVLSFLALFLGISFSNFPNSDDLKTGWSKSSLQDLMSNQGWTFYFDLIEDNKIKALANFWSKNKAEEKFFISLFQNVSIGIRIAIVKFLTKPSSSGGTINELVQTQQHEITQLQKRLNEQSKLSVDQFNELSIWKRRYNQIHLDVNEDKPSVEDEIKSFKENEMLKDKVKNLTEDYESKMIEKKETIKSLEEKLQDITSQNEHLTHEKENLQEELHSLATTYSTLEQMYNAVLEERRTNENTHEVASAGQSTTAPSEPTAGEESSSSNLQNGGEGTLEETEERITSTPQHSHEIVTLRQEIERLQQSGRAAEEWMSMAVQRMEDLTQENIKLKENQKDMEELRAQNEVLQTQQQASQGEASEETKEAGIEETKNFKTTSEFESEIEQKNQQIDQLEQANSAAQEWMSNAVLHHQHLVQQVETLTTEKAELLLKIESSQPQPITSSGNERSDELAALQEKIISLESQLDEKEDSLFELQSRASQYEKSLQDAEQEKEVINSKYQETLELLQAKQMENEQVKQEKETEVRKLANEVLNLKENQVLQNVAKDKSNSDQQVIQELHREKQLLEEELTSCKEAIESLNMKQEQEKQIHIDSVNNFKSKLLEYQNWVKTAQEKASELKSEKKLAEAKVKELQQQGQSRLEELEKLRDEKEDLEIEITKIKNETVDKFESQSDLEQQIVVLRESNVAYEVKIKNLLASNAELDSRNGILEMENIDNVDMIATQKEEIDSLKNSMETLQNQVKELQVEDRKHQIEADHVVELQREKEEILKKLNHAENIVIVKLKDEVSLLQNQVSSLESLNQEISKQEESNETLKKQVLELQTQIDTIKAEYEDRVTQLLESNNILEEKNGALEMENADLCDTLSSQSSKISNLEHEIREMILKLQAQETSLTDQIALLENEKQEILSKIYHLENTVLIDLKEELMMLQQQLATPKEQILELQGQLESLKSQYEEQMQLMTQEKDEALLKVSRMQEKQVEFDSMKSSLLSKDDEILKVKEENNSLSFQLTELQKQSSDIVSKWKERAESLEESVTTCQNEIKAKRKEAEDVIGQWEAHCTSLREQLEQYQTQPNEEELMNMVKDLEQQLVDKEYSIKNLEEEVEDAVKALEEMKVQSSEVVNQWKERCDQLESFISDLEENVNKEREEAEQTLIEQQASATNAITEWENQCTLLKNQVEELETLLDEAEENLSTIQEDFKKKDEDKECIINNLKEEIENSKIKNEKLLVKVDDLQACKDDSMQKLQKQGEELTATHQSYVELEQSYNIEIENRKKLENLLSDRQEEKLALEKAVIEKDNILLNIQETNKDKDLELEDEKKLLDRKATEARSEVERLQTEVGKLQAQLQTQNEALLFSNSENTSNQAIEMASNSLFSQLQSMKKELSSYEEAIAAEQRARLKAEKEIYRLKTDLVNISEQNYGTSDENSWRKLASKAADDAFRKERNEILELRNKLNRVTKELSVSAAREHELESKLNSLQAEANSYHQEIKTAKYDLQYANQTMKELQESMQNGYAAYQQRVDYLEEEKAQALRKYRDENLRLEQELQQALKDVDRFQHSLHESEKANASLVVTSIINNDDNLSVTDISKLRMEKEQLLLASADTAARAERRIREIYTSLNESESTELMLERELRRKAEDSLKDCQLELKSLTNSIKRSEVLDSTRDKVALSEKTKHQDEIEKLSNVVRILEEEKQELTEKIFEMEERYLEDQKKYFLRLSSENKNESNENTKFEVLVSAELARSRVYQKEEGKFSDGTSTFYNPLDLPSSNGHSQEQKLGADASHAFELISDMRKALLEEREHYQNLLSEHEDLLALVSYLDILKSLLQSALSTFGGSQVVDDILQEAAKEHSSLSLITSS